jgi:hypothetical protein
MRSNFTMYMYPKDIEMVTEFYKLFHEGKTAPKAKMVRFMIRTISIKSKI